MNRAGYSHPITADKCASRAAPELPPVEHGAKKEYGAAPM